jgi:thiamine biosynthesis lipoprotein
MNVAASLREYRINQKLMGCDFELMLVEDDDCKAQEALQKGIEEIQRIEELLSEFKATSRTSFINQHAARYPVEVDEETYQLMKRSKEISRLTQGAFDITVGPLKKLYSFKKNAASFPLEKAIYEALNKTGDRHLQLLTNNRVQFKKEGMQISFAAIGKGYAADRVMKLWKAMGIQAGVVNASGDLTVFGKRANGGDWKVGIANPDTKNEIVLWIPIHEGSIATSGDSEQFFMHNGIRYSHNLNPLTGLPLTGIKSVTVASPSAELCDALCTAVYVMGVEVGLHFINQLPKTHCLIMDDANRFHHSKNLTIEHA